MTYLSSKMLQDILRTYRKTTLEEKFIVPLCEMSYNSNFPKLVLFDFCIFISLNFSSSSKASLRKQFLIPKIDFV